MAARSILRSFCLWGILSKGLPAVVQTQSTVVAAVGERACLRCRLSEPKEVLQVTWQKLHPGGEKNLATWSKFFSSRVNADLKDKMEFQCSGLRNLSVVIRRVAEQDEGCYRCLFNTFSEGALIGRTCLRLYELHEPVLQIRPSNSSEGPVVWCSATGRPAPTVNLTVAGPNLSLSHHSSARVHNANGTVTVSRTAVLPAVASAGGARVGCAARVLSGPQTQAFVLVPELRPTPADGSTWIIVAVVLVALACCVAVAFIVLRLKMKSRNGDLEQTKTPQKPTPDPHNIRTPLIKQEAEIRQRPSAVKSPGNKRTPESRSSAKRLFEDCSEEIGV
ncbi:OX-2 membrane glycoprotein-like isoform 2-T2 [Menidia menidia]